MKTYSQLVAETLPEIKELFPWDVEARQQNDLLLLDIREPHEFDAMRIKGSINAPRGILEQCCEWDFEETIPELVQSRDKEVLIICRSGNRSVLAAYTMQLLGFQQVYSLKTGLAGWNDYELPLVDLQDQPVKIDATDKYFSTHLREDQKRPRT
jgi:rhodanese-related sulfurtransferase